MKTVANTKSHLWETECQYAVWNKLAHVGFNDGLWPIYVLSRACDSTSELTLYLTRCKI
jgi:hypothetical protein